MLREFFESGGGASSTVNAVAFPRALVGIGVAFDRAKRCDDRAGETEADVPGLVGI